MSQDFAGKQICICTPDFVHLVKNGGIGTSFYHTARILAQFGAEVTVLFANITEIYSDAQLKIARSKAAEYGVTLEFLFENVRQKEIEIDYYPNDIFTISSFATYGWLKQYLFDIVIFPDWRGLGFYSVLAKKQGLHFAQTALWVQAHSTTLWHALNNQHQHYSEVDLRVFYMERKSVELCDFLSSPTQYLLDWMKQHGFEFPAQTEMMPYLLDDALFEHLRLLDTDFARVASPTREIVFFGRLEKRKGIHIFVQALKRLLNDPDILGLGRLKVSFLGKLAEINNENSFYFINDTLKGAQLDYSVIPCLSFEEAINYIKTRNVIAVIASVADNSPLTVLESMKAGVSFLASRTGGIPEIIDAEDHQRVLFDLSPLTLAAKLKDALLLSDFASAKPACDQSVNKALWHDRLLSSIPQQEPTGGVEDSPSLTVCITHYERPALLRKTLEGLRAQTYRNFDIIIVDDGSRSDKALTFLASVSKEFPEFPIEILRQTNKYVGAARNKALKVATGEYVVFMDDDNYAHPLQIETFVRAITTSGYDALSCVAVAFDEQDDPANLEKIIHLYLPLGGSKVLNMFGNAYGDANGIYRRSALRAVGGFTEDWGISWEDYELFSRLEQEGFRVSVVPEPLMYLRVSSGSVSRRGAMIDNYYRALRPALEHADWSGYGDLMLFAINGSLAENSNTNYDAQEFSKDSLRLTRHSEDPLSVCRLMLRYIIENSNAQDAMGQMIVLMNSSRALADLGLDLGLLVLSRNGPKITAAELGALIKSERANVLISTVAEMFENGDGFAVYGRLKRGLNAFVRLHETDVMAGVKPSPEVAYLAGLSLLIEGKDLAAYQAWASCLEDVEQEYLAKNEDVKIGVELKHLANGLAHYVEHGTDEIRSIGYVAPTNMLFVESGAGPIPGFSSKATHVAHSHLSQDVRTEARELLWAVIRQGGVIAAASLAKVLLYRAERLYQAANPTRSMHSTGGTKTPLGWDRVEGREPPMAGLIAPGDLWDYIYTHLPRGRFGTAPDPSEDGIQASESREALKETSYPSFDERVDLFWATAQVNRALALNPSTFGRGIKPIDPSQGWNDVLEALQKLKLTIPAPADFDEHAYLLMNPDVAADVKALTQPSGYWHYLFFGRREARMRPTTS